MDDETKTEIETEVPNTETTAEATLTGKRKVALRETQDDVPHVAVARSEPARMAKAREFAMFAARIAHDNRAKDILLLDLRQATPLLDFFVIATANSRRAGNAIAVDIDIEMKRLGERKLGMEGTEEGRWILIDYGDFVVHLFSEDARAYYSLEEIWGDAPRLEWRDETRPAPSPPPRSE